MQNEVKGVDIVQLAIKTTLAMMKNQPHETSVQDAFALLDANIKLYAREPDTSDIPEADEVWLKAKVKLTPEDAEIVGRILSRGAWEVSLRPKTNGRSFEHELNHAGLVIVRVGAGEQPKPAPNVTPCVVCGSVEPCKCAVL